MGVKVKVFDEEHDKDLEEAINAFLSEKEIADNLIDIKFAMSHFNDGPEQIYSYSALVVYKE